VLVPRRFQLWLRVEAVDLINLARVQVAQVLAARAVDQTQVEQMPQAILVLAAGARAVVARVHQ
jgi:hypothetical protein